MHTLLNIDRAMKITWKGRYLIERKHALKCPFCHVQMQKHGKEVRVVKQTYIACSGIVYCEVIMQRYKCVPCHFTIVDDCNLNIKQKTTAQFRKEAIEFAAICSITAAARRYEISPSTLRRWRAHMDEYTYIYTPKKCYNMVK